jgi:ribosomal protein S18 acetylase RimI-like enzyme
VKIAYGEMTFEEDSKQTSRHIAGINRLLRQLSSRPRDVDWQTILRVLHDGTIVVARDDDAGGKMIGMGTVLFGCKLTAPFASIEDVVVDEGYRGHGIGEQITRLLIERAAERQVAYVDLTSSPRRVAANALYRKLGFVARETNPFRFDFAMQPAAATEDKRQAPARG